MTFVMTDRLQQDMIIEEVNKRSKFQIWICLGKENNIFHKPGNMNLVNGNVRISALKNGTYTISRIFSILLDC